MRSAGPRSGPDAIDNDLSIAAPNARVLDAGWGEAWWRGLNADAGFFCTNEPNEKFPHQRTQREIFRTNEPNGRFSGANPKNDFHTNEPISPEMRVKTQEDPSLTPIHPVIPGKLA